jgi:hypothetical protein
VRSSCMSSLYNSQSSLSPIHTAQCRNSRGSKCWNSSYRDDPTDPTDPTAETKGSAGRQQSY